MDTSFNAPSARLRQRIDRGRSPRVKGAPMRARSLNNARRPIKPEWKLETFIIKLRILFSTKIFAKSIIEFSNVFAFFSNFSQFTKKFVGVSAKWTKYSDSCDKIHVKHA